MKQQSGMTFGQAADEYIKTCELNNYSPSTIVGYNVIRRNGIHIIENISLKKMTLPDLQRQINERAETHTSKTVFNTWGFIHKVLSAYAPDIDTRAITLPKK